MRKRAIILVILCCFFNHSFSQDFNIGIKYGIGNTSYIRISDEIRTDKYSSHKVAAIVEFSPFLSKFFVCSALEFKNNDAGSNISIPLTFRVTFGKMVRPFIEGGGWYNYHLTDTEDRYILMNDLGAKAGTGLQLHLGKRWRIDAGYYHRFGITSGLKEEIILPLGQIQIEEYRIKENSFEISGKYRF